MKTSEQFYASVYAKAEAKQAQIKTRNRRIRNGSVSALCVLAVAALAVPLSRMNSVEPFPPPPTIVEQPVRRNELFLGPTNARMVLLYDGNGANAAVLLNDQTEKQAFVDEFRKANNLSENEGIPLAPALEEMITIQSVEELVEFLTELPQDIEFLQEAIDEFDEAFFLENDLCAMPIEFDLEPEELPDEAPEAAPDALPDDGSAYPDETDPDAAELRDPEVEPVSILDPANAVAGQGGSRVSLLLLVPMHK